MRYFRGHEVASTLLYVAVALPAAVSAAASAQEFPAYPPSARSPATMDIRTNAYGASDDAPRALAIGDAVTDFSVRRAGGGLLSLRQARGRGPVVIVFYRGHW